MRTDLDHLPAAKRAEIALAVRILFEEFEDATKLTTSPERKQGRILKVILFGSHARGDWVDDAASGYRSDYDLLVIVNHADLTDVADYWAKADDHLLRELQVTKRLAAPVNFIVHTMADVNDQLTRGRYFFTDIVREGIALYEAPGHPFAQPAPMSEAAARAEAHGYFDEWFSSAGDFYSQAQYAAENGRVKVAAFELHQAVERLYHCVLLVRTLHSPKSHKLNFLRSLAEGLDPRLIEAWPRADKPSRRCFELLRRAYVEARYSSRYTIGADELAWLSERVGVLQGIVRQICQEQLQGTDSSAATELPLRPSA